MDCRARRLERAASPPRRLAQRQRHEQPLVSAWRRPLAIALYLVAHLSQIISRGHLRLASLPWKAAMSDSVPIPPCLCAMWVGGAAAGVRGHGPRGAGVQCGVLEPRLLQTRQWFCTAWVNGGTLLTAYYLTQLMMITVGERSRGCRRYFCDSCTSEQRCGWMPMRAPAPVAMTPARRPRYRFRRSRTSRADKRDVWAATGTGWLQMESRAKKIGVAVLFLIPLALLMVRKLLGVEGYVPDLLLYVAAFTLLQSQRHAARVSLIVPRFVRLSSQPVEAAASRSLSLDSEDTPAQLNFGGVGTLHGRRCCK